MPGMNTVLSAFFFTGPLIMLLLSIFLGGKTKLNKHEVFRVVRKMERFFSTSAEHFVLFF